MKAYEEVRFASNGIVSKVKSILFGKEKKDISSYWKVEVGGTSYDSSGLEVNSNVVLDPALSKPYEIPLMLKFMELDNLPKKRKTAKDFMESVRYYYKGWIFNYQSYLTFNKSGLINAIVTAEDLRSERKASIDLFKELSKKEVRFFLSKRNLCFEEEDVEPQLVDSIIENRSLDDLGKAVELINRSEILYSLTGKEEDIIASKVFILPNFDKYLFKE